MNESKQIDAKIFLFQKIMSDKKIIILEVVKLNHMI
jgi:hypothetical protein